MKRPSIFVPLSVNVATGKTGTALLKAFGAEGIAIWVCYLAACKRNRPPGSIIFASETEAWTTLGLLDVDNAVDARPQFTLDDFFKVTGRLKQTRRRRVGRMLDVSCTHFGDWNKTIQTEYERERKARSRGESTRDKSGTPAGQNRDLELELERDKSSKQKGVAGDLTQPLAAEARRLLEHLKKNEGSTEPSLKEEIETGIRNAWHAYDREAFEEEIAKVETARGEQLKPSDRKRLVALWTALREPEPEFETDEAA